MNTSGSHAAVSLADVHTYGELLSGRGDLSALGYLRRDWDTYNEDADVFQSDNSDEDIDVLLTNEANDDFDDDGHEDPNIGEALHDNSHIPFFRNLVRVDDVVGDRDLYDRCLTWSDVTPEFVKGMVFKDKDALIHACNWYHVKKNKHYHVVETNKNVWSTRCSHDCPWKLRACLKKQHGFFEIKQYPGPHTCLHGMESLDHRNINSTFIAHLIKTQVAEDPGWKIASIIENVKNYSGFTVSYKKAWLGRTKAIAMVFGDWDASYEKLPRFMRTLGLRNPGTAVILETLDLGIMGVKALDRIFWPFRPCIEGFKHCLPVIGIDSTFLYVRHLIVQGQEGVTLMSDRHAAIGTDALTCRRCGSGLYDEELDPHVLQEASITLQDVAILLGLPVDGAPITHPQTFVTVQECQAICMQAFGVIPPAEEIDNGRLRMSWLRRTFDVLPEHADDVSVQRHARAYILRLIGGILLTDYSQILVRVAYVPLLLDLDAAGACSWGSAVLAMLYRSMCRAAKIGQRQIAGALLLLQGCISSVDHGELDFVRVYRDQLDRLRPDEFTCRPYDGIMYELPDYCRVASDIWFGLRQVVPAAPNTSPALHGIDMRGRARTDWTQFHRENIDRWHHRREYIVVGVIDVAAMRYDDLYMVWYRRITRTLVGNPAHRPTSGYVKIGSTIEIATQTRYIAAINDCIDRVIYAYNRPESLQDMYDARDMCSRSLHALRKHQRFGQPGVSEPPPTIPPGVPAASPAMPPAFPVHKPPSMSSSQQFTQYVSATQTFASYITPTIPSYTYHISSHDVPSSSRPSSSGIRPRRTTHRHITSPVTYDRCSSFSPVGDE
ncbi:hypothetical protein Acr_00g0100880 [Actinidia rufa]|uniref:Serine/threonine-protein phosphatase 7 long form-like n=1 Tax=Actinidia rufa TaxID=165716 RepID=A0A7J0DZZ2_9ERIC|nr:hypothetical protein Acr_00g0100880 [Actinidia rufa]